MPAASSYSESELAAYMIAVLPVASALGMTAASPAIASAVLAVERILGVSDVADLTDMAKLETIATWRAWQAAADTAAVRFDVSSGGGGGTSSAKLSQMFDQISKRLADALDAALVYPEVQAASGAGGVAVVVGLGGTVDPYGWPWCRAEFG